MGSWEAEQAAPRSVSLPAAPIYQPPGSQASGPQSWPGPSGSPVKPWVSRTPPWGHTLTPGPRATQPNPERPRGPEQAEAETERADGGAQTGCGSSRRVAWGGGQEGWPSPPRGQGPCPDPFPANTQRRQRQDLGVQVTPSLPKRGPGWGARGSGHRHPGRSTTRTGRGQPRGAEEGLPARHLLFPDRSDICGGTAGRTAGPGGDRAPSLGPLLCDPGAGCILPAPGVTLLPRHSPQHWL